MYNKFDTLKAAEWEYIKYTGICYGHIYVLHIYQPCVCSNYICIHDQHMFLIFLSYHMNPFFITSHRI